MDRILDRAALKAASKEQMRGNLGTLILYTVVIAIATAIITTILRIIPHIGPLLGSLASFGISAITTYGITKMYLNLVDGIPPTTDVIISGVFQWTRTLVTLLLVSLFTWLWSLLLFVPGIIKGLSYSQAFYILVDEPDMSAGDAIKESMRIMDGHKMELFMLQLSFIPWALLCVVTFGIAGFYVGPYMQTTLANYYCYVRDCAPLTATYAPTAEPYSAPYTAPTAEPYAAPTIEPTVDLYSAPAVDSTVEQPYSAPIYSPITGEPIVSPEVEPTGEPTDEV